MNSFPCQRIEICRQCGHKRLPLSRLHLRNAPVMKHRTTNYLDIKMPHPERPPRRLPHHGKRLGLDVGERLPALQPRAELRRLHLQLFVGEPPKRRLESAGCVHEAAVVPDHPGVEAA
uniref:ATP binding / protein binding n=2 Tax=Arundo donax TaxID=35708 RepID=A0A0A9EXM4_ARUDO